MLQYEQYMKELEETEDFVYTMYKLADCTDDE